MDLKQKIISILPQPNDEILRQYRYIDEWPIDWSEAIEKANSDIADKILAMMSAGRSGS